MKYFKKNNEVYAFDDEQLNLITSEMTAMTDEEVDRHINPQNYYTDEEKRAAYLLTLRDLSQKQFRMTLSNCKLQNSENSMYVDVKAAISNIADTTQKEQVEIAFEYADYFSRTDPLVIYMCSLLGLTDEQVDAMWEAAMSI